MEFSLSQFGSGQAIPEDVSRCGLLESGTLNRRERGEREEWREKRDISRVLQNSKIMRRQNCQEHGLKQRQKKRKK